MYFAHFVYSQAPHYVTGKEYILLGQAEAFSILHSRIPA